MASDRLPPTLADYVVIVLSPALIMGLVGSLAFFILEVMYRGQYEGKLQWTVFFFVFGAVLLGRISMMAEIAGRYWIYAPVLGLVTLVVLATYVKYRPEHPATPYRVPINFGLVLVVLWSTYQLMWDCTHVDDDGDPTAMGLLEAAGLEEAPPEDTTARDAEEAKDPKGVWGWITRYQRYRAKKKRRRVLGVWVVYFALATLPIFGLGQALIDPDDAARRRWVFWLTTVYAGSALGLLLTTCFLGLRRYLRQRHIKMPAAMTGVWLATGGLLVLVLLALGALLPRPSAEYRLIDLTPLGNPERQASKYSPTKDNPGKDKGQPGSKPGDNEKGEGVRDKDKPQGDGDKGDKAGKGDKGEKGAKGEKDKKDRGEESKNGEANKGTKERESPSEQSSPASAVKEFFAQLAKWFKWIAFGVVALVVVVALLRGGLRYLANFTQWARDLLDFLRNFWARLFGGAAAEVAAQKKGAAAVSGGVEEEARPFAWYRNPWADGTAGQRTLQELIRFTFAALQAWAAERGVLREIGETPLEFAARLGDEAPALAEAVDHFIELYLRAEYAGGRLPAASADEVRRFWERLERATEQPLSA
jgi:hypothetical protein